LSQQQIRAFNMKLLGNTNVKRDIIPSKAFHQSLVCVHSEKKKKRKIALAVVNSILAPLFSTVLDILHSNNPQQAKFFVITLTRSQLVT
jgi:hypothetical protein